MSTNGDPAGRWLCNLVLLGVGLLLLRLMWSPLLEGGGVLLFSTFAALAAGAGAAFAFCAIGRVRDAFRRSLMSEAGWLPYVVPLLFAVAAQAILSAGGRALAVTMLGEPGSVVAMSAAALLLGVAGGFLGALELIVDTRRRGTPLWVLFLVLLFFYFMVSPGHISLILAALIAPAFCFAVLFSIFELWATKMRAHYKVLLLLLLLCVGGATWMLRDLYVRSNSPSEPPVMGFVERLDRAFSGVITPTLLPGHDKISVYYCGNMSDPEVFALAEMGSLIGTLTVEDRSGSVKNPAIWRPINKVYSPFAMEEYKRYDVVILGRPAAFGSVIGAPFAVFGGSAEEMTARYAALAVDGYLAVSEDAGYDLAMFEAAFANKARAAFPADVVIFSNHEIETDLEKLADTYAELFPHSRFSVSPGSLPVLLKIAMEEGVRRPPEPIYRDAPWSGAPLWAGGAFAAAALLYMLARLLFCGTRRAGELCDGWEEGVYAGALAAILLGCSTFMNFDVSAHYLVLALLVMIMLLLLPNSGRQATRGLYVSGLLLLLLPLPLLWWPNGIFVVCALFVASRIKLLGFPMRVVMLSSAPLAVLFLDISLSRAMLVIGCWGIANILAYRVVRRPVQAEGVLPYGAVALFGAAVGAGVAYVCGGWLFWLAAALLIWRIPVVFRAGEVK